MRTQTKEYRETQLYNAWSVWGSSRRISAEELDLSDAEFDRYIEMLDTGNKITRECISNQIPSYKDYVKEFEKWERNAIERLREGYYKGMSVSGIEKEIECMKTETKQADKRTYNGKMTRTLNKCKIQIAEMIIEFIKYSCLIGTDSEGQNIYQSPLGYTFRTTGTR